MFVINVGARRAPNAQRVSIHQIRSLVLKVGKIVELFLFKYKIADINGKYQSTTYK